MKAKELKCHCDNCPLIEWCTDFDITPLCEQPRFEDVDVTLLKNVLGHVEEFLLNAKETELEEGKE